MEEARHVNQILKRYLNESQLILVFERGNQIGDVNELFDNNIVEKYDNWIYNSTAYRLIITFSYKPETIKKLIDNKPNFNKKDICNRYLEQSKTNGVNLPENIPIYPLEFGRSLSDREKELSDGQFKKVNDIINELWEDIRIDISKSRSQIDSLRHIPKRFQKIKDDLIIEHKNFILQKQKKIESIDSEIEELEISISNKNEKIESLRTLLSYLSELSGFSISSEYNGQIKKKNMRNKIAKIITDFSENCIKIQNILSENKLQLRLNLDDWPSNVRRIFSEIDKQIENRVFEKERKIWLISLGGPDEDDQKELNKCIRKFNDKVKDCFNTQLAEAKAKFKLATEKKINSLKNYNTISDNKIKSKNDEKSTIVKEIKNLEESHNEEIQGLERDIKQANKINRILKDSLVQELKEYKIANNLDSMENLLRIFYSYMVLKNYDVNIDNFN